MEIWKRIFCACFVIVLFFVIFLGWKKEKRVLLQWSNCSVTSAEYIYDSSVSKNDCYLCGTGGGGFFVVHAGEEQLGIINFVSLELINIEINQSSSDRYAGKKELLGISTFMKYDGQGGFKYEVTTDTRNKCATVSVKEDGKLDPDRLSSALCRDCLNHVMAFDEETDFTGLGVVNYRTGEMYFVSEQVESFEVGDYYVVCEFEEGSEEMKEVKILIIYC